MKNLVFINGTMGVGKTTTSKFLLKLLPDCIFLDGDWCWYADPFVVNDETKRMVKDNMGYLLNNFLLNSAYNNILFCWVMDEDSIINEILSLIKIQNYKLYKFSLVCSKNALASRIKNDVENGVRSVSVLERALLRQQNYMQMDTIKIDVSDNTPEDAAHIMLRYISK